MDGVQGVRVVLAAFCWWQKGYFLSGQTGRDCSVPLGQPLRRRSRSLVQTRRGAGPGEAHKLGIIETYEVNLHSDTGKLARRQGYGKGDGPWWEFLPGLFLYCFFIMIRGKTDRKIQSQELVGRRESHG